MKAEYRFRPRQFIFSHSLSQPRYGTSIISIVVEVRSDNRLPPSSGLFRGIRMGAVSHLEIGLGIWTIFFFGKKPWVVFDFWISPENLEWCHGLSPFHETDTDPRLSSCFSCELGVSIWDAIGPGRGRIRGIRGNLGLFPCGKQLRNVLLGRNESLLSVIDAWRCWTWSDLNVFVFAFSEVGWDQSNSNWRLF